MLQRKLKCKTMSTNHGTNEEFFKTSLKDIALSGYKNFSPPNFLLARDDYKILKGLKDDTGVVLVKPDKGNGIVFLNKADHCFKMDAILREQI